MSKKGRKNDKAEAVEPMADDFVESDRVEESVVDDVVDAPPGYLTKKGKLKEDFYLERLVRLQEELTKLQYWVKEKGLRVAIVFEGRDAAGKGGVIKRIVERTNPRIIHVTALGIPNNREKGQWYFQRWVAQLPAAGEIVLFDRSWYTRAITEYVHDFCTEEEYREFLASCPQFERMLLRSGMILLKYWFSVSDEEQERRFQLRASDIKRRWKLSPMDIKSRDMWVEYSQAKDRMFDFTDTKQSPWFVVNADDKRRARLNCISHILSQIPYEDILPPPIVLPPRKESSGYIRPPIDQQTFVPDLFK
ncbi:MAG: polyphosphate kinase 2 [Candidatus Promineofilum sp.]|nr:polyphosphate kinase 2 [Promineifilum sp.]